MYHKRPRAIGATEPHVKALFRFMEANGISIETAAGKSGVDRDVISNWRRGKSTPLLVLFVAVCEAVGLVLSVVLSSKKPKSSTDQLELL